MDWMRAATSLVFGMALVAGPGADPMRAATTPEGPAVPDTHTSRTSLDWAGTYEGLLPCADCAGIKTRLSLASDLTYSMESVPLRAGAETLRANGTFSWLPDGNNVELDRSGSGRRFAVGEGRLTEWNSDGSRPGPKAQGQSLQRLSSAEASEGTVAEFMRDHQWRLDTALTGANQRIDVLFPRARPFEFRFAESSFHVTGGCNGFRGGYRIDDSGVFHATPMASTLMACAEELMAADQALGKLLAEPLQLMLVRGAPPTLILVSPASPVLLLSGTRTLESLYGPATRVFLEVAPQTVPCPEPESATPCLNVREIQFDDQGRRLGEPGPWQPFTGRIQGYEHTPGVRDILRVKRFQPPAGEPAIHVLDLVVESETVAQ